MLLKPRTLQAKMRRLDYMSDKPCDSHTGHAKWDTGRVPHRHWSLSRMGRQGIWIAVPMTYHSCVEAEKCW